MKIANVKIEGFGVWSDLDLGKLDRQLTVFYGPNEAGKTTLLEFIRSMIFGFAPGRRKRYLPPVSGATGGGSLAITSPQGNFEIVRRDGGRDPIEGDLRLLGPDGTMQSEHVLSAVLCGVDEPTFNNVFAVGLRDIQELGTLGDTAAADMLYGLTTGLDRISLADVLRELAASRARILSDDARSSQISQLSAQRERIVTELEHLRSQSRDYGELIGRRQQLDRHIEQAEVEATELERSARLLDVAAAIREKWDRRKQLDAQLAALGQPPALPAGALEDFDHLTAACERRRRRHKHLRRQLHGSREELARLADRPLVARLAPRIEALVEQRAWAASLAADVARHDAEIAELQGRLQRDAASLGAEFANVPTASEPVSRKTFARLKQAARLHRDLRERVKNTQADAERAKSTASQLADEIRAALAGRAEKELTPAIERAGTLVTQLRRRVQLDERLEQMTRGRTELQDRSHELLERQVMPLSFVAALGGLFVFGVTLILAGIFMGSAFLGPMGWTLALLGLGGTCAAAGSKFYFEYSANQQLEAGQKQLTLLEAQLAQAKDERDALDRQLPKGGGPLLARLQAAEKELSRLEELLAVDGRRSVAQQEADAARAAASQLRGEQQDAQRRWQHALAAAGLPKETRPGQIRELIASRHSLGEATVRIERLHREGQQRRRDLDGFLGRIRQLLAELEIQPAGTGFDDHLRQLEDTLRDHHAQLAGRERWRTRTEELRRLQRKNQRQLRIVRRRRLALLRRAHVRDAQEFRDRAIQAVKAASLRTQRDKIAAEIALATGPQLSEELLHDPLERLGPVQLDAHARDLAARRQASRQQLQVLSEQRGQLSVQLRTLADDRRASHKLLELGTIDQQLREAIERWQVLAITGRLLESIRRTYEADRQPATLQEASGYLRQLTEGRYRRVWTPVDENVLLVDDAAGQSLPVEVLSSGTREQLFLSLRLALVSAYASRGASLPLVLDDVLVNFDTHRAKATAAVLRDFAAGGFQLLVFTCHEHIAQLFQSLKVHTRELPTRGVAESRSSKRSRKLPTVVEEPQEEEEVVLPAALANEDSDELDAANEALAASAAEDAEHDEDLVPVRPRKAKSRRGQGKKKRRTRETKVREPFASAIWHEPVEDETGGSASSRNGSIDLDDEDVIWPAGASGDEESLDDLFADPDDDTEAA